MKASVKLRGDSGNREPLVRAKLPMSILGVPFSSGLSLGCGDGGSGGELALHLSTLFDVGPLARLSYKPRSSEISMLLKTGFGPWGSPKEGGSLIMAAELSLNNGGKPSFSLHLRPQCGNFSLRKDATGVIQRFNKQEPDHHQIPKVCDDDIDSSNKVDDEKVSSPVSSQGSSLVMVSSSSSQDDGDEVHEQFVQENPKQQEISKESKVQEYPKQKNNSSKGGWSLAAHTGLPLGRHAVAKVRWKVQMPSDFLNQVENFASFRRLPVLVIDKFSIEASEGVPRGRKKRGFRHHFHTEFGGTDVENGELGKVASVCSSIKRQLHLLYVENRMLRKTMEDMKNDLSGRNANKSCMVLDDQVFGPSFGHSTRDQKQGRRELDDPQHPYHQSPSPGYHPNPSSSGKPEDEDEDDVSEQLKQAIMSSSSKQ